MPFLFHRKSKARRRSDEAGAAKQGLPRSSSMSANDYNNIRNDSPLINKAKRMRKSVEIGNVSEPIIPYRSETPVLPDIHSIRTKHPSVEQHPILPNSTVNSSRTSMAISTRDPATLGLQIINPKSSTQDFESRVSKFASKTDLRESSPASDKSNKPLAASSPVNASSQPEDVEAHLANTDSTMKNKNADNSGLMSSFLAVAHNAASHIGSFASQHEEFIAHPPPKNLSPPANDMQNSSESGSSLMQHLDSILFAQSKRPSRAPSSEPLNSDNNDNVSSISKEHSALEDIKFQPLKKTVISTMGNGELTLEALGVPSTNGQSISAAPLISNNSSQIPSIVIDKQQLPQQNTQLDTEPTVSLNPGHAIKTSAPSTGLVDKNTASNGTADMKLITEVARKSRRSLSVDRNDGDGSKASASVGRNNSISAFRRSLSPTFLQKGKAAINLSAQDLNNSHAHARPMVHTGSTGNEPLVNRSSMAISRDTTFESINTNTSSSVELKDVHFASSKRNAEFHQSFKQIPAHERLVEDYSCALQKDILLQGKMYISEKHVCFNSNILGYVTNIVIPLREMVQLEKKTVAGLFPNSILIQTLHQKYLFASFLSRDATFDLITKIWNQSVRGPVDDSNLNVNVDIDDHDSYGEQSALSDEDSQYDEDDDDEDTNDSDDSLTSSSGENEEHKTAKPTSIVGPVKHDPTEPEHKAVSGETTVKEDVINAPLGKVFQSLFGDDTSIIKAIIEKQKNYNISPIPAFSTNGDVKKRQYSYTKPLNSPVGPKETLCKVTETIDFQDFNSYVQVTQSTQTPDVPSGDAFNVETTFYLSWGPKNSTKILVVTSVHWTGKSWIKTVVEKGTISGQKESIGILVDELKSSLHGEVSSKPSHEDTKPTLNLPTVGPAVHAPTENEYKKSNSDTLLLDETFNVPVGTLYSILFGDDTSYYKSIMEKQKNFDITTVPPFKSESGTKTRNYSYTKPLNGPIGPKQTRCNITETIEYFDLNKYIEITQSTSTPDVPYGNAFTVKTKFYFSWSANNSTKLLIVTFVNWTGRSLLRGPIEKGSIDGQHESINILSSELKSIIKNATSSGGHKPRKRTKSKSAGTKKAESVPAQEEINKNSQPSFLNFTSPVSFQTLVIAILVLLFLSRIFRSENRITLSSVEKITIGGNTYMLIPEVDDSLQNESLKKSSEYEIWKWINDRTARDNEIGHDYLEKLKSEHNAKDQELSEMVKLTEQHLDKLKYELDKRQDNKIHI